MKYVIAVIVLLVGIIIWTEYEKKPKIVPHKNPDAVIDTIFLGYRFSMDKKAVLKHTLALIDSGILQKDGRDFFYLYEGHKCRFSPTYDFAGKIEILGLSVESEVPILTQVNIYGKLIEKYGYEGWRESEGVLDDSKTFTYKEGNMEIKILQGFTDARVYYLNLAAAKDTALPKASPNPF